jgi:hypothetical protein
MALLCNYCKMLLLTFLLVIVLQVLGLIVECEMPRLRDGSCVTVSKCVVPVCLATTLRRHRDPFMGSAAAAGCYRVVSFSGFGALSSSVAVPLVVALAARVRR